MANFDQLDQVILKLLSRDGRMPSAQIAHQLGKSARTIQHRIQKLIDQNAIQIAAVPNPFAFGYTLTVDIYCELEVGYQEQALQALLDMPQITYLALSTGDQDINLQAIFKDSADMQDFITNRLHQVPGMRRTRTVLIPRVLKDTHQWLPKDSDFDQAVTISPGT
jgi:Lrp/AsnC family transcriptional regulator for asnA, asnC and gidA